MRVPINVRDFFFCDFFIKRKRGGGELINFKKIESC